MSTLNFAVVAKPEQAPALAAFCERLQESTGLNVQPKVLEAYPALAAGVIDGTLDAVWAPPLVAVDLEARGAARSVAVVERSLRAGYYCALFVHPKSAIRKVEDLKGARAGWVSKESASGYVVPRWHVRSAGHDLDQLFAEQKFFDGHDEVTQAVLDGEVDTGATHVGLDAVTHELSHAPWIHLGLAPGAVRVILLIGPIPGDVIMASTKIPDDVAQSLTAALLSMGRTNEARTLFEASSFEPVADGHLSMLRQLSRFRETDSGS